MSKHFILRIYQFKTWNQNKVSLGCRPIDSVSKINEIQCLAVLHLSGTQILCLIYSSFIIPLLFPNSVLLTYLLIKGRGKNLNHILGVVYKMINFSKMSDCMINHMAKITFGKGDGKTGWLGGDKIVKKMFSTLYESQFRCSETKCVIWNKTLSTSLLSRK